MLLLRPSSLYPQPHPDNLTFILPPLLMQRQHETNNGRCGVCGDAYDDVKPLFIPPSGTFATGIVGRCYLTGTRYLSATVQLTSSHLGYFDFRLCVNNDFQKPVRLAPLDRWISSFFFTLSLGC